MNLDDAKDEARAQIEGSDLLERLADRVGAAARATAVFGPAVERDEVTVVPVARATWGFGGGSGSDGRDQHGSGGGAGGLVRPIGYIEVDSQGARFRPLRSRRNAALAAGLAAGLAGLVTGALVGRR